MITPNKFISFDQSVLSKLNVILSEEDNEIEVCELYRRTEKKFDGVDQFLYAIDVLHVLGRINVDLVTRTVTYVS